MKVKVGIEPEDDVARVRAVRAAIAKAAPAARVSATK